MQTVKVTNPLWFGQLGNKVADFTKKLDIPGIVYESLYQYFVSTVQFGKEGAEFAMVVDDDDKPVGFAHWFVKALPHTGKVHLDYIYTWTNHTEPVPMLLDAFLEFSKKNNAPLLEIDTYHPSVENKADSTAQSPANRVRQSPFFLL